MNNQNLIDVARKAIILLNTALRNEPTRPYPFAEATYSLCRAIDVLAARPGMDKYISGLLVNPDELKQEVAQLRDEAQRLKQEADQLREENQRLKNKTMEERQTG